MAFGKKKFASPVGEWKRQETGGRYLTWEGTGMPCITCFRLWVVATGHMESDGICIYSCTAAFALGRAPPQAPPPPAAPPPLTTWPPSAAAAPQAHSLHQEREPPPQAASSPQGAAAMTVRLSTPVPTFAHGPMGPQSMVMDPGTYSTDTSLPAEDCVGGGGVPPPISSLQICDLDDDDTDWPAFRESPVKTPSIDRNNSGSTFAGLRAPPPGGAE
ncbi:hypothetical protein CYMTET_49203 [Cymbomonas tetramitiformis]|uniref:Uncharacterized protein n=1 Tax=Cymbomonas tetramitiformis TaxID=36881 RepID=A0AAE0BSN0_9CHLO|nr:hypothetical protein CYMTET_49203 [Cymbomonas tetramitiformis]